MTPASGVDHTGDQPEETYGGPQRIDVPGELASELVQVEDFENVLRWVIGLEKSANVSVDTLQDPLRLVVDMETG